MSMKRFWQNLKRIKDGLEEREEWDLFAEWKEIDYKRIAHGALGIDYHSPEECCDQCDERKSVPTIPIEDLRKQVRHNKYAVIVKTLTGVQFAVICTPSDTIAFLLDRIEERTGYPPPQMRLIYNGRQISTWDDSKPLGETRLFETEHYPEIMQILALRGD